MKGITCALVAGLLASSAANAADVSVGDSTTGWFGYMNVTDLAGNFQFGSPWGLGDLVAVFNDPGQKITLKVNSIGDPNPYWYIGGGQSGAQGNKIMEANFYHEVTNQYAGETVTFRGTINSNTFDASHHAIIFIKDFAPNFSTFNITTILVTPGPFSISLNTDGGVGRHVQWGFAVTGPCVWITDADLFGSVVISTIAPAACPADFNGDTAVDFFDYDDFVTCFEGGVCPPGKTADFNNDTAIDFFDYDDFVVAFETPC